MLLVSLFLSFHFALLLLQLQLSTANLDVNNVIITPSNVTKVYSFVVNKYSHMWGPAACGLEANCLLRIEKTPLPKSCKGVYHFPKLLKISEKSSAELASFLQNTLEERQSGKMVMWNDSSVAHTKEVHRRSRCTSITTTNDGVPLNMLNAKQKAQLCHKGLQPLNEARASFMEQGKCMLEHLQLANVTHCDMNFHGHIAGKNMLFKAGIVRMFDFDLALVEGFGASLMEQCSIPTVRSLGAIFTERCA